MYPGDFIEEGKFNLVSPYRAKLRPEGLSHLIDEEYKETRSLKKRRPKKINKEEADKLLEKLKEHINNKLYVIPEGKRKDIKYAIQHSDYNDSIYHTVDLKGSQPRVYETTELEKDCILSIKIKSTTLLFSLENEWGGDAIIIGYGCLVEIFDIKTVAQGLDNLCVRLITNYPNTKEYLKRVPLRAMKYLLTDSIKRNNLLTRFKPMAKKSLKFSDPKLGDNLLWLSKSKCQICNACNLPEQMPLLT